MKKLTMKKLTAILAAALMLLTTLCGCGDKAGKTISVKVSVDCVFAIISGSETALAVTPDGILYPEQAVSLPEKSTIYDALNATGLVIGANSSPTGTYVYSIQSVREGDCGSASGWIFTVNGAFVTDSCDKYVLHDGDVVRWQYTCDGGADLGFTWQ